MDMDKIYTMKLHQTIDMAGKVDAEITRVPGGWIYRFFNTIKVVSTDGKWGENYLCDSVFVPFTVDETQATL